MTILRDRPEDRAAEIAALFDRFEAAPVDMRAKTRLARLLRANSDAVPLDRGDLLHRLLLDPDIDPDYVSVAGWSSLARLGRMPAATDPRAIAEWVEGDGFAQDLLRQSPVATLAAELPLSAARRWLLLSDTWADYPKTLSALRDQAALNGGAWPFDAEERARLDTGVADEIALAYLPVPPAAGSALADADATTQAVAAQYGRWPYPAWSRPMASGQSTLGRLAARVDPDGPLAQSSPETLLIAGCGTGWEAAIWARRFPDARITGIDISETSLAYATERCTALGIDNLLFERLDLHQVARLGQKFDMIVSSGVLHHLADPEAGWAALVDALAPGGMMRLMLYSRVARIGIEALRLQLADLRAMPVSDDVLREARARLITRYPGQMANAEYYTLGGILDLLFNVQEDTFDIPRIERDIEDLGLKFLGFALPEGRSQERYLARFPHDPLRRDFAVWRQLERENPLAFEAMYGFWCRKRDS